ncbi:hypothetical protein ACJMK2_009380, partial [Sinanodonta woodiana]
STWLEMWSYQSQQGWKCIDKFRNVVIIKSTSKKCGHIKVNKVRNVVISKTTRREMWSYQTQQEWEVVMSKST